MHYVSICQSCPARREWGWHLMQARPKTSVLYSSDPIIAGKSDKPVKHIEECMQMQMSRTSCPHGLGEGHMDHCFLHCGDDAHCPCAGDNEKLSVMDTTP